MGLVVWFVKVLVRLKDFINIMVLKRGMLPIFLGCCGFKGVIHGGKIEKSVDLKNRWALFLLAGIIRNSGRFGSNFQYLTPVEALSLYKEGLRIEREL